MTLALVEESFGLVDEQLKIDLFKKMIRKDLEVTALHNKAVSVFGEFDLFSKMGDELSAFDMMISFLTGIPTKELDNVLLGEASVNCVEDYLGKIIEKKMVFTTADFEIYAERYANYILKVVEAYLKNELVERFIHLKQKHLLGGVIQ